MHVQDRQSTSTATNGTASSGPTCRFTKSEADAIYQQVLSAKYPKEKEALLSSFTVTEIHTCLAPLLDDRQKQALGRESPPDLGVRYFIKSMPKVYVLSGGSPMQAARQIAEEIGHNSVYLGDSAPTRMGDWSTRVISPFNLPWTSGGVSFDMAVARAGHPDRIDRLSVDEHFRVSHTRGPTSPGAPVRQPSPRDESAWRRFAGELMTNAG